MLLGILLILFGGVFTTLGLLSLYKPTFGWSLNEGWKIKGDSEPSEAYIESMKFRGTLGTPIGIFFIICGVLLLFL